MKTMYEVKMYVDEQDWGSHFFFSYIKARDLSEIMMSWTDNREDYREIKYGAEKGKRYKTFKPIVRHWVHDTGHKYEIYIQKFPG